MTFSHFLLRPELLAAADYKSPTAIQQLAIPLILAKQDLIAIAQTGTGKTAAFTLPILQNLAAQPTTSAAPRALILTPTRELALQVADKVAAYGRHTALTSLVLHGGVSYDAQKDQLAQGVDIVIATPGRLRDLLEQQCVSLAALQVVVLDEADRMLDMGFIEDVAAIMALTPPQRQTLLFSATFSPEIKALAQRFLRQPQTVQATPKQLTAQQVTHIVHPVTAARKLDLLLHLLTTYPEGRVLVFARTKLRADEVAKALSARGHFCMATHSGRTQAYRTKAMACFKDGRVRVLVGTDMVARGLDIGDLNLVVNYEIPNLPEDYVHRIGRTGRAGASGLALSLVTQAEMHLLAPIEQLIKTAIPQVVVAGFAPPVPLTKSEAVAAPRAKTRSARWGGAGKPRKTRR